MPHNFWHGTKRRFKIPLQQISFIKNTEHNLSHLKLINAYNPPRYKSSIKRCKHDEFDRMALAHKTQLFTIQWYSKIPPKFLTITNVSWQYELKSYIIKWREKWLVFFIAQQIFFTGEKKIENIANLGRYFCHINTSWFVCFEGFFPPSYNT